MVAQSITLVGEKTATGIVQSIAANGSGFTITTTHGRTRDLPRSGSQPARTGAR